MQFAFCGIGRAGSRRAALVGLACCLGLGTLSVPPSMARAAEPSAGEGLRVELRQLIEQARNRVFPALVHVQLVTSQYYGGKEIKGRSVGSGSIISPDGYVVTNQHVTNNGRHFRCTLADKQEVSAELVGEDPLTDLAVLKLNLDELDDPHDPLPVAKFGDSDQMQVGDFVMAMGSPLALSRSVTLGIISNMARVFAGGLGNEDIDDMRLSDGQRTGLFTRWIQHDALINPGNSGGPLINLEGEIIGINELGGASIGFAIPSNLAREVVDKLIADGEVVRSWIGVSFKPIDKTGFLRGVLVNSVVEGSPADKAGIQAGDLVVQIDDEPVTIRFAEEVPLLLKEIADRPLGTSLSLAYEREGQRHETAIVTEKLQRDRGDETEFRRWGITALEITPLTARERRLSSSEGVIVSGVRGGALAAVAKPPLNYGDVIKSLDGEPIRDLPHFTERYQALLAQEPPPEHVLVEFERQGESYVTVIKPSDNRDDDPPPPNVPKAWIGVAVQPVLKDLAAILGLGDEVGYRVTQVYPGTLAAESELKAGDVITHINGEALRPRRPEDTGLFQLAVRRLDIGATAQLRVLRDGQEQTVAVALERTRTQPGEAKRETNDDFELAVREVTFFDRVSHRWDDKVQGVIVVDADSAGWAGIGGIQPGDLVQRIEQFTITDLASFREAMDAMAQRKPERVVMVVLRGAGTRFQYIETQWDPPPTEESAD